MSDLPESVENELKPLRAEIDSIDKQLVELLNKRAQCARKVGEVKGRVNAPVFRPERENVVIRNAAANNRGPLPSEALGRIFREIMSACRSLEEKISVAYLGPKGTYSEMAMEKQFGSSVNGIACDRIDEIFRAVEAGTAQFGIVPMENSTEGSVNRTLDCLLRTDLTIIGECSIPIHHNLLTKSGTLDGITRVYSHPQSLGQCVGWLNAHVPALDRLTASSNGEAARIASEDEHVAAIASERAGVAYGLKVVQSHIQDDACNRTRFVVLSRHSTLPSKAPGKDKTSLIISMPNRAGSLYHCLAPLSAHKVSMTRFESRPARNGAWEYYFYLDIEGHAKTPEIQAALDDLKNACAFYKYLGSYPFELTFADNCAEEVCDGKDND